MRGKEGVDLIGQTISHYRVLEKIGQGGIGEVYLAEDSSLRRKVAMKFLPETLQQDRIARKRFIREAQSAAALDHPFICNIHEVGQHEDRDFIVMEWMQSQSLKDKLADGLLPSNYALQIRVEIAEAFGIALQKTVPKAADSARIEFT